VEDRIEAFTTEDAVKCAEVAEIDPLGAVRGMSVVVENEVDPDHLPTIAQEATLKDGPEEAGRAGDKCS
jgi:hypothetical protein